MSVILQARGKGLPPVNSDCTSDSLAAFLEREGYTDIRVKVTTPPKPKAVNSGNSAHRPKKRVITRRARA